VLSGLSPWFAKHDVTRRSNRPPTVQTLPTGIRGMLLACRKVVPLELVDMAEYRFYNLEQAGQMVICVLRLSLKSDEIAVEYARQLTVGETVEVWRGNQLVATLPIAIERISVAA
jgi:hypothetical protein